MPAKKTYLVKNINITPFQVITLDLKPAKGTKQFDFIAGQYAQIAFKQGKKVTPEHAFSIASSPLNKNGLQFGIKIFGKYTEELSNLKIGDQVMVRGPFGEFVLDERRPESIVLLAAGIGITPFISMLRYARDRQLTNDITLIFSGRRLAEIPFYEEIRQLEKTLPNFHNYFYITDEKSSATEPCFNFNRLDSSGLNKSLNKKLNNRLYYICGPTPFTKAMIECLQKSGVKKKNIIIEGFSLIPINFFEDGTHAFPVVVGLAASLTALTSLIFYQAGTRITPSQPATSPPVISTPIQTKITTPTPPAPTATPTYRVRTRTS